jgi:hypothetical protein
MNENVSHLANDLDNLINRYRAEYDITYAEMVGVLSMKIHLLNEEAIERQEEL